VTPPEAPAASVPRYVQVAHPAGYDVSDIRAIFLDPTAPDKKTLANCDADFKKLMEVTRSEDERKEGTLELIHADPAAYHWCFYSKILELEDSLGSDTYVDVRQKHVLDTYSFLVPIARAYISEFHDSRYLRWAMKHYRKISEWVFFRKLELSPQATVDLVEATNPFGAWRDPNEKAKQTILEKYSIVKAGTPTITTVAPEVAASPGTSVDREPASVSMTPQPAFSAPPEPEGLPSPTETPSS
jgi:hypothetical protein